MYDGSFAFLEANPRLQVEHTVTEELTGVDLVKAQLRLARGCSLAELGLAQANVEFRRGFAMELRVNLETIDASGRARPAAGTLTAFEPPSGPGIRVDTFGYAGYSTNPRFDSLVAKVICYSPSPDFADVVTRAYRALCEFRVEGVGDQHPVPAAPVAASGFSRAADRHAFRRGSSSPIWQAPAHPTSENVLRRSLRTPGAGAAKSGR